MRASLAALSGVLVLSAFSVAPHPARAQEVTFLSTQMRPLEEAQRARTQILNGAPVKTTYVPEEPPQKSPSSRVSRRPIRKESRSETVTTSSMYSKRRFCGTKSSPIPSTLYDLAVSPE